MPKGLILILATPLVLAFTPVTALATSADVATTKAYVQADYSFVRETHAKIGAAENALTKLLRQVKSQCPNAVAGSPQDHDSERLSYEVVGALTVAVTHVFVRPGIDYISAVQHLRWSNRTITRMVQSYVTNLITLGTLPMPNLCADMQAWAASGYQTLSVYTTSFLALYTPVEEVGLTGEVAGGRLAAYESPGERAILHRTANFEAQLQEFEAGKGVDTYSEILTVLGLNQ